MNRSFYQFGIFFTGLAIAFSLLHHIIYLKFGNIIYGRESFMGWFLIGCITYLFGSIFILKYFYHRNYWSSLLTGAIHVVATVCYFVILFMMLQKTGLQSYYVTVLFITSIAGMVYSLSLVVSDAGKRYWLKKAGILSFFITLVLTSLLIWYFLSKDNEVKSMLESIQQWLSLAGSLIPVLFIINFRHELDILKTETGDAKHQQPVYSILGIVGFLTFVFAIFFGTRLARESYTAVYAENRVFEHTKKMAEQFEARSFVNSKGEKLLYRLLKPINFDPAMKYPLVVSLPYGSQTGIDTIRQIQGAAAAELLASKMNRNKFPAFLFIPNCPPGAGWGGIPNYPTVDSLVFQAIDALQQQEPTIDVKRCYVTGISRGGYGAWHFISMPPDMFAAAIPVCGGGDPQLAPKLVDVSIWAFHGEKDKNAPVSGSRDMIEAIKKSGGHPRYTEYKGAGHNIWDKVIETPGLWEWLFEQKRD